MTDKVYSPYKLAIELGFSEELAMHYEERGVDATKLRQIARAMDLLKPKLGKPEPKREPTEFGSGIILAHDVEPDAKPKLDNMLPIVTKKHSHHYRKDGVCSCGRKRKVKAEAAG